MFSVTPALSAPLSKSQSRRSEPQITHSCLRTLKTGLASMLYTKMAPSPPSVWCGSVPSGVEGAIRTGAAPNMYPNKAWMAAWALTL